MALARRKLDFSHATFLPSGVAKKRGMRKIPAYFLYGEAPRRIAGRLLHVETIEARSAGHHWKIEPHLHQLLHQMVFVLSGHGVVLADGTRSQYRPPALVLNPAGSVHGFEFEPGTTGHVLSISDELLQEIARREPAAGALFAQSLTLELHGSALRATELARSVRMLVRESTRSGAGHELALQGWLDLLFASALRLVREQPSPADAVVGRRRALVARFHERIEQRFRHNQSVAEYAAMLSVSESRLRTACLAVTGQSPIQLIHARILLEAKRQLHYTDNLVGEIAYGLGFEDPAYFTRFFSRRAAMSPRVFRARGPEHTEGT